MSTNALGAVKLPAYVTNVKKREAALPPAPVAPMPPPIAPPPTAGAPSEMPGQFSSCTPQSSRLSSTSWRHLPHNKDRCYPLKYRLLDEGSHEG